MNLIARSVSHFQPRRRIYFGPIILSSQPRNWIRRKKSFASREWIESQVRYGEWIRERNKPNQYLIYAEVIERTEPIKVLIKIKKEPDHVLVYHAHVVQNTSYMITI